MPNTHETSRPKKKEPKNASVPQDIDFDQFRNKGEHGREIGDLKGLDSKEKQLMEDVAVLATEEQRSGTYVQIDQETSFFNNLMSSPGLDVLSVEASQKKYPWVNEYLWKLVPRERDQFTEQAAKNPHNGYFIRAGPDMKIKDPVQACLMIKHGAIQQNVHNLIICEPNSELHVITGCTTPRDLEEALHIGVSEFYVKRGAKLTFTMIHRWSPESLVRPRTTAYLEEGATLVNNYVILSSVGDLQAFPTVILAGRNAHASMYSTIFGTKNSRYDIGSRLLLQSPGTAGEVISHSVANDSSVIIARGDLRATATDTRAHLACNGLLLGEKAIIRAVPELSAEVTGAALSHEATVGKIEQEQLVYLMSRGLSEEDANALIVRGFMDISPPGLPPILRKTIDDAITMAVKGL